MVGGYKLGISFYLLAVTQLLIVAMVLILDKKVEKKKNKNVYL